MTSTDVMINILKIFNTTHNVDAVYDYMGAAIEEYGEWIVLDFMEWRRTSINVNRYSTNKELYELYLKERKNNANS